MRAGRFVAAGFMVHQERAIVTKRAMRGAALALAAMGVVGGAASPARATLLLYEGFDYAAGQGLGGVTGQVSGAGAPVGQTNPSGATWHAHNQTINSGGAPYVQANDAQTVAGSLSYPGLAASIGGAVTHGRTNGATGNDTTYTDAINLPTEILRGSTDHSVYMSFIVKLGAAGTRFNFAGLYQNAVTANGNGLNAGTAAATTTEPHSGFVGPLAAVFERNSGSNVQFGAGKGNLDGIARANSATWQATNTTNQKGASSEVATDTYLIVLRYRFNADLDSTVLASVNPLSPSSPLPTGSASSMQHDVLSLYVNPISNSLGVAGGEDAAAAVGGALYSAINGIGTAGFDSAAIRSFLLFGHSSTTNNSTPFTFDELRIGTTWEDVTPVPEPTCVAALGLIGAGVLARRHRT